MKNELIKFLLSNISDYDHEDIKDNEMVILDKWIINKANILNSEIKKDYDKFKFHKVAQDIINFCTLELGGYYLDIIKDRLYTSKKDGLPRKSAQKACYILMRYINCWIAPILTFTAEEIFSKVDNKKDSIYLNNWFETSINITNQEIELFNDLYSIKSDVSRLIEEARNNNKVGSSLECKVEINCNKNLYDKIKLLENELKFIFITSECHLKLSDNEFDHPIKHGDEKLYFIRCN